MSFWKRPHVVAAVLVAPILAVLTYLAVDALVGERAAPAAAGVPYRLVAASNCRRAGQQCTLRNASFELHIVVTEFDERRGALEVTASHPLSQLALAVARTPADRPAPTVFAAAADDGRVWRGELAAPGSETATVQLAATASQSAFFAEFPATFMAPR